MDRRTGVESAVAVIDIGMTNKKVVVYDSSLRLLDSVSRTFAPLMVEGLETHDLAAMEEWFLDTLALFAKRHPIKAISVTTHGATLVCVGEDGLPAAPCVYYTHEPGDEFQERFYRAVGDQVELQAVTGTPRLSALINPAKSLLFLSERFPLDYAKSAIVLSYPQYWGFRLTGLAGAEGTYVANHSYLWDWKRERYSSVADVLGVAGKLASPLRRSWDVLGFLTPAMARRTGLPSSTLVTMGIHDSNASLLPHLVKRGSKGFVLNSTGTWCVLMHPQERYEFAEGELGKVVFFNRSAYLGPVKTAIFLGGREHEAWSALIARACSGRCGDPGPEAYPPIIAAKDSFILPEIVPGSGQFPGSLPRAVERGRVYGYEDMVAGAAVPDFMRDGGKAMALLDLSLVIQTIVALERTGLEPGMDIFTEGGFRKNDDYNSLLAAALPGNSLYLTDIDEATAFGAAMTAVAALEGRDPASLGGRFDVDYRGVSPMRGLGDFEAYGAAWRGLVDAADKQRGAST
jgi:sugar (pentulose or hexulose) kinase